MRAESTRTGASVTFFSRTYDEALQLTIEARDYIAGRGARERDKLSAGGRLAASCEEMRLTARLTQVMAWLLIQRAVHEGEISWADAAADHHRLAGQAACLAEPVVPDEELPERLAELLARSRHLYERVQRLDAMLDRVSG